MKVWKAVNDQQSVYRVNILLNKLGETPDGLHEWLGTRSALKKYRGTNLVYKIYVDEESRLCITFGSGALNQRQDGYSKKWVCKRLIRMLRDLRDKHLLPEKVSVWCATSMLKNEKLRHELLSEQVTKEQRVRAFRQLKSKVREMDGVVQNFVLEINAQITRLQKCIDGELKTKET